ncbi:MAG: cell division protein ZapE [Cellvibrionaceae bacterium]
MPLSPLERYQADLKQSGFQYDPCQEVVVQHLQDLYDRLLLSDVKAQAKGFFTFWKSKTPVDPEIGLYLWGGVGRGKTYLMDTFFDSLPFENKMRVHFHRFMKRVHHELTLCAGHKDPLESIAEKLSKETRIICFDEFFVSDITDAMLLGTLFQGLFKRGVSLVATSNIVPDLLYENGLQRERFLPAIALVKQFTKVVHVDSPTDYRLRALEKAELYHSPIDEEAETSLQKSFMSLKPEHAEVRRKIPLEVEGRPILAKQVSEDIVWFDFLALCDGPRSQNDYIELAKEYHAVLISGVPVFTYVNNDQSRRFINLVDEFYDRNVKLVLSAEKPLDQIYQSGTLEFEFERTASRLLEMQSHEYLAMAHKP